MNDYQQEQWDALETAVAQWGFLSSAERQQLMQEMASYLAYRREVDRFQSDHFAQHCIRSCYANQRSACCSKDGIVTFWADVIINVSCSSQASIEKLFDSLKTPFSESKCTYLRSDGCCWQVRPLMCAMFLCEPLQEEIFSGDEACRARWNQLKQQAQTFRWPVGPVLFDRLETFFMDRGCRSPLMYINTTPALLRIKRQSQENRHPESEV